MYFSRVTINAREAEPEKLVALVRGDLYTIHQTLWYLFPAAPDTKRDFIFREESCDGWPFFYMVSKRRPEPLANLIDVETKPYRPQLSKGNRLSFCLRANPVVTKKTDSGRRVRHDVVMDAKRSYPKPFATNSEISAGELEYTAGINWLQARSEKHGFRFVPAEVRVFGYRQQRFAGHKRRAPIRFSSLDFIGLLTVEDIDRFSYTLFNGLGRAKAFGCGLVLVRRA
jgi:CRISPR system Cascade subunit CasE